MCINGTVKLSSCCRVTTVDQENGKFSSGDPLAEDYQEVPMLE